MHLLCKYDELPNDHPSLDVVCPLSCHHFQVHFLTRRKVEFVTGTGRQQQAQRTSIKGSSNDGTPGSFLTMEEARLIETLNLEMHEQ
jgi:hypothetical protein